MDADGYTRRRFSIGVGAVSIGGLAGCAATDSRPSTGVTGSRTYRLNLDRTGAALNVDAPTPPWQEVWSVGSDARFRTSPAIVDGVVYVASDFTLYAIGADDGVEVWRQEFQTTTLSSPAVVGGTVFVGSGNRVYAFDRQTGAKEWEYTTEGSVVASPAVTDGTLYVGSTDNHLYAIDADSGSQEWKFETGGWVGTPAVRDDTVYVGSEDAVLYAIDAASGTEDWSFETTGPITSPPALDSEALYVTSRGKALYKVDSSTGEQTWQIKTNEKLYSGPAVANGTVYFGNKRLNAVDATDGSTDWKTERSYLTAPVVIDAGILVSTVNHRTIDLIDPSDGTRKTSYPVDSLIVTHPSISEDAIVVSSYDKVSSLEPL
jgi:outer membrane protein assembly factor BamB